jgi:hypothetical protein
MSILSPLWSLGARAGSIAGWRGFSSATFRAAELVGGKQTTRQLLALASHQYVKDGLIAGAFDGLVQAGEHVYVHGTDMESLKAFKLDTNRMLITSAVTMGSVSAIHRMNNNVRDMISDATRRRLDSNIGLKDYKAATATQLHGKKVPADANNPVWEKVKQRLPELSVKIQTVLGSALASQAVMSEYREAVDAINTVSVGFGLNKETGLIDQIVCSVNGTPTFLISRDGSVLMPTSLEKLAASDEIDIHLGDLDLMRDLFSRDSQLLLAKWGNEAAKKYPREPGTAEPNLQNPFIGDDSAVVIDYTVLVGYLVGTDQTIDRSEAKFLAQLDVLVSATIQLHGFDGLSEWFAQQMVYGYGADVDEAQNSEWVEAVKNTLRSFFPENEERDNRDRLDQLDRINPIHSLTHGGVNRSGDNAGASIADRDTPSATNSLLELATAADGIKEARSIEERARDINSVFKKSSELETDFRELRAMYPSTYIVSEMDTFVGILAKKHGYNLASEVVRVFVNNYLEGRVHD